MSVAKIRIALLLAAPLAFGLNACINDSEDHHDEHHAWEHACEYAGETPTAVTANADTALAPLVGSAHTLYNVAFTAGGRVKLNFDEHGDFGIFLTSVVPVTLTTASGDTVDFEETVTPLEGCPELAVMHVAHADEGVHFLTFGASARTSVNLLVEELEHAH